MLVQGLDRSGETYIQVHFKTWKPFDFGPVQSTSKVVGVKKLAGSECYMCLFKVLEEKAEYKSNQTNNLEKGGKINLKTYIQYWR